ncbi:Wzz/FepE/Etk N-terminal domain-containing protein [Pseudomonas sp. BN102]|uniref:LPS O-antigen chain length determinant protein WzzB n=1 Tax=Pseudomonas sp. BN102 TaxID=2567886 RepID=UPI0024546D4A|nr:Wzz/FepE/Etk N-terminal domain-containing protein [Pseudomonas sp. BN102]MDH4607306.1 chain-length determining protein [Pseudomonas sp. BN102]
MNDSVNPARDQQYNEIDLIELVRSVWKYKIFISVAAFVGGFIAAGYAYLSSPVYEARISFLPPSLSDIAPLSSGRSQIGLAPFLVGDVYSVFTRNLESDDSLRRFFKSVYLPSLREQDRDGVSRGKLYSRFLKEFNVVAPDRLRPDRYSLVVQGEDPEQISGWITTYVNQVAGESLEQAIQDARREVDVAASNLQQQIATLRATAKARRDDRIIQLKESLKVAEAVGLVKPPVLSGQTSDQLNAIMDGSLTYMRGSKALRAELNALQSRVSDDPFISPLRGLEEKYELYASIAAVSPKVRVFRQDGDVVVPDEPIKPKKTLIIALGVVLGGMLGGIFAVARVVLRRRASFV